MDSDAIETTDAARHLVIERHCSIAHGSNRPSRPPSLVLTNEHLGTRRRADSVIQPRACPPPRPGAYLAPLILVRSRLKRTHHIGRAVSRSSAVAARRTALAATAVARGCQALYDPSCSPIAARARRAGRAGLLLLNRLLRLNVVGPRGRARLLSGATSGGRRMRPRVGRLAGRGGACCRIGRVEACAVRPRSRSSSAVFVVRATCL